jgi:arginine exporter protein ArgO
MVNPLTITYFVVVAAGLGDRLSGAVAATAFVVGVFLASWAWQLVLASAGAAAGLRAGAGLRRWSGLVGYAVVAAYGVHLGLS